MNEEDLLFELLSHDKKTILQNPELLNALVLNGYLYKLGGEMLHDNTKLLTHYIVKRPFMHYEIHTLVTA